MQSINPNLQEEINFLKEPLNNVFATFMPMATSRNISLNISLNNSIYTNMYNYGNII